MFIGRSKELSAIRDGCSAPVGAAGPVGIGLISGPAGVGKSMLLDQALRDLNTDDLLLLKVDGKLLPTAVRESPLRLTDEHLAPASLPSPADPNRDYFPSTRSVARKFGTLLDTTSAELATRSASAETRRFVAALFRTGVLLTAAIKPERWHELAEEHQIQGAEEAIRILKESLSSLKEMSWSERMRSRLASTIALSGTTPAFWRLREQFFDALADAYATDLELAIGVATYRSAIRYYRRSIRDIQRLVIVLDDYEALGPAQSVFLSEYLIPRLARGRTFKTLIVLIGRDDGVVDLRSQAWISHLEKYHRFECRLQPFDEIEARELLKQSKVPHEQWGTIIQQSNRHPYLLAYFARYGVGARSLDVFYSRVTSWMSTEQRGWFDEILYLNVVNEDTIRLVLPELSKEEVRRVMAWFVRETSVQDPASQQFGVLPLIRSLCRRHFLNIRGSEHVARLRRIEAEERTVLGYDAAAMTSVRTDDSSVEALQAVGVGGVEDPSGIDAPKE